MICIYVSTYDLNKCPLLSCFICLMNFELEIWRLQNWWGIMLPYLWWLHKGGSAMVMPPDWGTQCIPRWRLQMLRPTESLLKQLCCLRQGLQSKEVGDGNPKKEFSKWKGHSTLASFDSCFHFGDFDYWPTPFFSFRQRLPLNYNEILWGVWGWHHLNNIQQVMFPAFCHPKIL